MSKEDIELVKKERIFNELYEEAKKIQIYYVLFSLDREEKRLLQSIQITIFI